MTQNIFPELDGWDDINSSGGTIGTGINKAIHKLVVAISNLRSTASSQLIYLQNKVTDLNGSFKELNENIKRAEESSTELARALNKLTFWGVIVAGSGIVIVLVQFLFENKIWPFSLV